PPPRPGWLGTGGVWASPPPLPVAPPRALGNPGGGKRSWSPVVDRPRSEPPQASSARALTARPIARPHLNATDSLLEPRPSAENKPNISRENAPRAWTRVHFCRSGPCALAQEPRLAWADRGGRGH